MNAKVSYVIELHGGRYCVETNGHVTLWTAGDDDRAEQLVRSHLREWGFQAPTDLFEQLGEDDDFEVQVQAAA